MPVPLLPLALEPLVPVPLLPLAPLPVPLALALLVPLLPPVPVLPGVPLLLPLPAPPSPSPVGDALPWLLPHAPASATVAARKGNAIMTRVIRMTPPRQSSTDRSHHTTAAVVEGAHWCRAVGVSRAL